jgi:hypothetical protein
LKKHDTNATDPFVRVTVLEQVIFQSLIWIRWRTLKSELATLKNNNNYNLSVGAEPRKDPIFQSEKSPYLFFTRRGRLGWRKVGKLVREPGAGRLRAVSQKGPNKTRQRAKASPMENE